MVKDYEHLNCVLMSLMGTGLLLGILSKIPVDEQVQGRLSNIKTLNDYIYYVLEDSMDRKVDTENRLEIASFQLEYDITYIFVPMPGNTKGLIARFIDLSSYLDEKGKRDLKMEIDEWYEKGDIEGALFRLTRSKSNFTIKEFIKFAKMVNIPKKGLLIT